MSKFTQAVILVGFFAIAGVSYLQDGTIRIQTALIRAMVKNPACMLDLDQLNNGIKKIPHVGKVPEVRGF